MRLDNLLLKIGCLSPFHYKATRCGHQTKRTGKVSAFGRTIITQMPRNERSSVDYCLDCISKMAIRCAWCGDPIFIGEPITLYSPTDAFKFPEYAVVYEKNPLQLVGCLAWGCADTGADRAGFWIPGEDGKGHVHRVMTAYEAVFSGKEPSMLVVRNPGDIAEAMNPTLVPLKCQKAE